MHVLLPLSWTERCVKQCFSAPSNWREMLAEFQKSRSDAEVHVTEGILECIWVNHFFHTGKAEFESLDVTRLRGMSWATLKTPIITAYHRCGIWCFCVCGWIFHCPNLISWCFNYMKMCSSRHNLLLFLPTKWPEIRGPLLVPSSQQDGSEHSQGEVCCSLAVSFSCPWKKRLLILRKMCS